MTVAEVKVKNTIEENEKPDAVETSLPRLPFNELNAEASCKVSTKGIELKVELSAGKISKEVGIFKVEANPNLTTSVTINTSGVETRVGDTGLTVTTEYVEVHSPAGKNC